MNTNNKAPQVQLWGLQMTLFISKEEKHLFCPKSKSPCLWGAQRNER
jgi:hypothetical protein